MLNKRCLTYVLAAALALGPAGGPAAAAPAAPQAGPDSIAQAQRALAALEADALSAHQAYRQAQAREHTARIALAAAVGRADSAQAASDQARSRLGGFAAATYRTGGAASIGTLAALLQQKDPGRYLDGAGLNERVAYDLGEVAGRADEDRRAADAARAAAGAAAAQVTAAQAATDAAARTADDAVTAAAARLSALNTQFDALLGAAAGYSAPPPDQPGRPESEAAARAIGFALAQVGKPYLWGATGPGSFDCSGLTMRAYQAAGVSLPHFAAFQFKASHPIAYSELRPGDLLFWATDGHDPNTIYHEALYLGGGRMVQAPKSHWNVMISSIWMWGPVQLFARP